MKRIRPPGWISRAHSDSGGEAVGEVVDRVDAEHGIEAVVLEGQPPAAVEAEKAARSPSPREEARATAWAIPAASASSP